MKLNPLLPISVHLFFGQIVVPQMWQQRINVTQQKICQLLGPFRLMVRWRNHYGTYFNLTTTISNSKMRWWQRFVIFHCCHTFVGVVWIYNMKQATLAKIERKISNMVNDGHKQTKKPIVLLVTFTAVPKTQFKSCLINNSSLFC